MPWKESSVVDERLRFVARLLEGEPLPERLPIADAAISVRMGGLHTWLGLAIGRKETRSAGVRIGRNAPCSKIRLVAPPGARPAPLSASDWRHTYTEVRLGLFPTLGERFSHPRPVHSRSAFSK